MAVTAVCAHLHEDTAYRDESTNREFVGESEQWGQARTAHHTQCPTVTPEPTSHFLAQWSVAACDCHAFVKWQVTLKTILHIFNLNQFRVNLNCHLANCCHVVQGHFESCILDRGVCILAHRM